MVTRVQKINPDNFMAEELEDACNILRNGGLVAFPTETVYGLGGDAFNPLASSKIYEAKGRPSDNPLIVHIADMEDLYKVADDITDNGLKLAETFWPGPLTIIFKKKEEVPLSTTGGLGTVAVRMPSHAVARELIRQSGVCIAAPSANKSGRPSPVRAEHVIEDLDGRIGLVIDGGSTGIGIESSIVDASGSEVVILRPGYITKDMLLNVTGNVSTDPAIESRMPGEGIIAKAPGMKYRHYAPEGKTAVIATDETKKLYKCKIIKSIGSRKNEASIAAGLYDILREMDNLGVQYIYSESFDNDILGGAVMNRMIKAAAYHIVQA